MTEQMSYDQLLSRLEHIKNELSASDSPAADAVAEAVEIIEVLADRVSKLETAVAEEENRRQWRRERQHEGIVAAKERGVSFGRPRMKVPDNFEEVKALWLAHEISSREGAHRVGVSQDTFLRWCKSEWFC